VRDRRIVPEMAHTVGREIGKRVIEKHNLKPIRVKPSESTDELLERLLGETPAFRKGDKTS
jgi:hypothetical protein